jgi:hypothetical protein
MSCFLTSLVLFPLLQTDSLKEADLKNRILACVAHRRALVLNIFVMKSHFIIVALFVPSIFSIEWLICFPYLVRIVTFMVAPCHVWVGRFALSSPPQYMFNKLTKSQRISSAFYTAAGHPIFVLFNFLSFLRYRLFSCELLRSKKRII